MSWLPASASGETPMDRVFGLRPNLYEQYEHFSSLFWTLRPVDPVLLELCRLRIAQLLGCASALAIRNQPARPAGLTDAKVGALADWRGAPEFSDTERACLGFAEKFVTDPHGVTDADAAAVTAHLAATEMVAFTEALAVFDGFTRFKVILGIDSE